MSALRNVIKSNTRFYIYTYFSFFVHSIILIYVNQILYFQYNKIICLIKYYYNQLPMIDIENKES